MLYMLKKALQESRNIQIIYMSSNDELTSRIIRVLRIKDNHVEAYCYYRKEKRTFKIENVLSGKILSAYKKGA